MEEEAVVVHPHVFVRHPDLSEEDVLSAWDNTLRWVERSRSAFDEVMTVGISASGKAVEMVGVYRSDGSWLIYHAMCPPTGKALREGRSMKDKKPMGMAYNGTELSDELLDSLAEEYESGTWSGHTGEVHVGRPRFGEEKLIPVTIKIAPSKLAEIDQLAADRDETRSEAMRHVIDRGLAAVS